jgi:hypothetical protein
MNNRIKSLATLLSLVIAGCASPGVNPAVPKSSTGYVDFYTDSCMDLSWRVRRVEASGKLRDVHSSYRSVPGNILRLTAPAGTNQFEVWFNNRATTGPTRVSVPVANAKVTPVHITLGGMGETGVRVESPGFRQTGRGTRNVTQTTTEDQQTFEIRAVSALPDDYQLKEQMPYFLAAPR